MNIPDDSLCLGDVITFLVGGGVTVGVGDEGEAWKIWC